MKAFCHSNCYESDFKSSFQTSQNYKEAARNGTSAFSSHILVNSQAKTSQYISGIYLTASKQNIILEGLPNIHLEFYFFMTSSNFPGNNFDARE